MSWKEKGTCGKVRFYGSIEGLGQVSTGLEAVNLLTII
jgi:hypothetical protein